MGKFKSSIWFDLIIILLAGSLRLLIHYQGWQSPEKTNLDMLPYFLGAKNFLQTGQIMEKGELSSYASYNPPGTLYLIIPGMILAKDPRLQDLAGTALLFGVTLVFAYLTAREISGRAAALAVSVILLISRAGPMGLWPVGHSVFIITSLYFLILWVKRRAAWALGAALSVLAFGLYVDLAIIPFVFVIPCVWLIYRPPVGWRSLLLAGVFSVALWFPYLRYESERGFVDMASILLLRPAETVGKNVEITPVYCYSAGPGENDERNDMYLPYVGGPEIEKRVVYPLAGWKNQLAYRLCRVLINVDRNFDGDIFLLGPSPILNAAVWWLFTTGWVALFCLALRPWQPVRKVLDRITPKKIWWMLATAIGGAILLYLLFNPDFIANFAADRDLSRTFALVVQQLQGFAPLVWLAIIFGLYIAVSVPERNPEYGILLLAFSLPWTIVVLLAEPGKAERFWYVWPLQVIVLVLVVQWLAGRLLRPNVVFAVLMVALGIAIMPLPFYSEKISNWQTQGYAGEESDQWNAIDYLAGQASSENHTVWVDYWLMDSLTPPDPRYPTNTIRDWFEYLLEDQYGVQNLAVLNPAQTEEYKWKLVDSDVALPSDVEDMEPKAVFGHYRIYQLP